jgi:hypothetical protein
MAAWASGGVAVRRRSGLEASDLEARRHGFKPSGSENPLERVANTGHIGRSAGWILNSF